MTEPATAEMWREMYVAVASLYAELLERFDLAEDAQPDDIIRAARADLADRIIAAVESIPGVVGHATCYDAVAVLSAIREASDDRRA